MNAGAFRHFTNDPFAENRKIWEEYVTPLARLPRVLNGLGVKTTSRDTIFYAYDHP